MNSHVLLRQNTVVIIDLIILMAVIRNTRFALEIKSDRNKPAKNSQNYELEILFEVIVSAIDTTNILKVIS